MTKSSDDEATDSTQVIDDAQTDLRNARPPEAFRTCAGMATPDALNDLLSEES